MKKPLSPLVLTALLASAPLTGAQEITGRDGRRLVVPAPVRKPEPGPLIRDSGRRGRDGVDRVGGGPEIVRVARKLSATAGGVTGLGSRRSFGSSLTSLGDLDGNGSPDLATGMVYDGGGPFVDSGVWIVFLDEDGRGQGLQEISSVQGGFTGAIDNTFGSAVAGLGDLDGDGNADLGVGEWGNDRVWILFLNADGTVRSQSSFVGSPNHRFGISLVALGDLDGDGTTELAVGSTHDNSTGMHAQGSATVVFLDAAGAVKRTQEIGDGRGSFTGVLAANDRFGSSVSALGDLDGDGLVDLAVGAPGDDDGGTSTGSMWILFLQADGTVRAHQKLSPAQGGLTGIVPGDAFGGAATSLGDLDGDGNPELAVGDPGAFALTGGLWIVFLGADGTVRSQGRIDPAQGELAGELEPGDFLGSALGPLPDLDGDGLCELAVGAPDDDDGGEDLGAVWILSLRGLVNLDFETEDDFATPLENGRRIDPSEEFGRLVEIQGVGPDNYGAAIFDSDPDGPNAPGSGGTDPDLLVDLGNLLVLQENQQQSVPDVFDQPDDAQLGGTLVFDFLQPVRMSSLDLIDICPGPPVQDAAVTLFDGAANLRTYFVPGGWTSDRVVGPPGFDTLSLDTLEPQAGFMATATATESEGFDPDDVVRVEVALSSSGALDNVKFDPNPRGGEPQTVTLGPSKDNTLIQSASGSLSNGMGFQFFAGRVGLMGLGTARRGVLAFDVAGSVPAGATITSASLTLHLSLTNTSARDVSLHRLAKDWGEGTSVSGGGAGDLSTPGDATWIHTFFDTGLWDVPGGDFDELALATTNVEDPGFYTWTSPALVAGVQAWLDDPATNFGWAVLGDESFFQTAKGFDSRENPTVNQRPVLTIEFTN